MKKILAFLLAISTIFTSFSLTAVMAEDEADYTFYLDFVKNLGIIDDISEPNLPVARQELAVYLNNIITGKSNVVLSSDDFFLDDKDNVLFVPSTNTGVFDDVLQSDSSYMSIKKINELGIMKGTGYRTFSPESNVSFAQLATVLVRTLGYSYKVENENYLRVAEAIGVFEDIAFEATGDVSLGELAKALYNCLDINVVTADMKGDHVIYKEKADVDMFNEFMDVFEYRGMLEENPYTKVNDRKQGSKGKIVVGGKEFASEAGEELYSLIGRDVNVFYKQSKKDDIATVIWGYATGRDEALTISAEQLVSFVRGELSYEKDGKIKNVDVATNAVLIKNGIYQGSFKYTDEANSDFDFEHGDITVIIPQDKTDYSIIIVNDYKSMKVESVNTSRGLLNCRQFYNGELTSLSLANDKYDAWRVTYTNSEGMPATLGDIQEGMVIDVLYNEEAPSSYIKIIISDKKVENATIKSMTGVTEEGITYTFTDSSSLTMPKTYYDKLVANNVQPKLGSTYTFGINSFGNIVYVEAAGAVEGTRFIYAIVRKFDEFEDRAVLKYLNTSGKVVTSDFKKGAVLIDGRGVSKTLKNASDVKQYVVDPNQPQSWDDHDSYKGVAQITLDKEGRITKMVLPITDTSKARKGVLGAMVDNFADGLTTDHFEGPESGRRHFNNVAYDGSTVGFMIDTTKTEESEQYTIFSDFNSLGGNPYTIAAYNFDSDSVVADCIALKPTTVLNKLPYREPLYVVTDVYEGVYDDEPHTMIEMTSFGREVTSTSVTVPMKKGVSAKSFAITNSDKTGRNPDESVTVQKGDIVFAEIKNDIIVELDVIYRILGTDNHLYDTSGKLVGNNYFVSTEIAGKLTNPYTLNLNNLGLVESNATSQSLNSNSWQLRFLAGNVYSMEDNMYLTYTTARVKDGVMYNPDDSAYIKEMIALPTKFTTITVEGKKITVKQGSAADILTYKDAGTACSEIFLCSQQGAMRRMAIINVIE